MAPTGVNMGCSRELQGIGFILGSDCKRTKLASAASLRRTLSADMSSRKWLSHHGFSSSSSTLKKTPSEEFQQVVNNTASDAATEQPPSQLDVWNSIQSDKMKKKESEAEVVVASGKKLQPAETWGSILSQKSAPLPAPYVHPLAKTSRSLSQKSLEICTESLGSETGSDGFSSSEASSDAEDEHEHEQEQEEPIVVKQEQVLVHDDIVDYRSYFASKSTSYVSSSSLPSSSSSSSPCSRSVRSFPPPLPSLSRPKLHMRPRRVDGRLVLEAIPAPAPPSHNFHAQRQDGRLRLTFINSSSSPNAETTQNQEQEEGKQLNQIEKKIEEKEERMMMNKEEKPIVPTGVIDVRLSAMGTKKLMRLTNRNPRNWTSKLNQKVGHEIEEDQEDDEEENEENSAQKALPVSLIASATRVPRLISTAARTATAAATATAASFINTYEYCWRTKQATISVGINHPVLIHQQSSPPLFTKSYTKSLVSKNLNPSSSQQYYYQNYQQQKQQFVVLSGADYCYKDSPTIRGCKEPKRSLMIREACCIATS